MAPKCSRSRGTLFTLPWNPCSPSRGNPIHDRVERTTAAVTAQRTLYFSENNPLEQFFITVEGHAHALRPQQSSQHRDHAACSRGLDYREPDVEAP